MADNYKQKKDSGLNEYCHHLHLRGLSMSNFDTLPV